MLELACLYSFSQQTPFSIPGRLEEHEAGEACADTGEAAERVRQSEDGTKFARLADLHISGPRGFSGRAG